MHTFCNRTWWMGRDSNPLSARRVVYSHLISPRTRPIHVGNCQLGLRSQRRRSESNRESGGLQPPVLPFDYDAMNSIQFSTFVCQEFLTTSGWYPTPCGFGCQPTSQRIFRERILLVDLMGFEPTTSSLQGRHSSQSELQAHG